MLFPSLSQVVRNSAHVPPHGFASTGHNANPYNLSSAPRQREALRTIYTLANIDLAHVMKPVCIFCEAPNTISWVGKSGPQKKGEERLDWQSSPQME